MEYPYHFESQQGQVSVRRTTRVLTERFDRFLNDREQCRKKAYAYQNNARILVTKPHTDKRYDDT